VGMRLFMRDGFDVTTVDDIADAAEVSRGTLFRYFKTKSEIVLAWSQGTTRILVDALRSRPSDEDPITSLREAFILLSATVAEKRPRFTAKTCRVGGCPE
jgi:AcrR family transcriptional regulator